VEAQPPIAWVAPNAIARDDAGGSNCTFLFRSQGFHPPCRVIIMQGNRVLYARTFGGLRPNVSFQLGSDWLSMVHRDGPPVSVVVADCRR